MAKTRYNFTIHPKVLEALEEMATEDNRAVSNWLESMVVRLYAERRGAEKAKALLKLTK